jgi:L-seryl-tRNA(Ser) seleniumtransferase
MSIDESEGRSASVSRQRLRELPAVDRLATELCEQSDLETTSVAEAVAAARAVLAQRRTELLAGELDDVDLCERARARLAPSLRRVLNGTGVIVHTNLGRIPLADSAVTAVAVAARSYVNLEMDLATGERRVRDAHITDLLCELTGAEDAMAVNNGAGAVLLAVAALAGQGCSIVVSRGQLVEIGGGFRIPDIVAQAGAKLIEVGTTNRTRIDDYQTALDAGAGLVLRVHQSNFRTSGFVSEVDIEALCALEVPVIDDVGSGVFPELELFIEEPAISRSVHAGAALVCFSGDKLLGGPQAGILVGSANAIDACRKHPLTRALRIGRLPLAGLAATLALYRDPERALREIPVLAMITLDETLLQRRAECVAEGTGGHVINAIARVGGGALPILELAGPAVMLDDSHDPVGLAATLRMCDPPLLARVSHGRVLIDPRTLRDGEVDLVVDVVRRALELHARRVTASDERSLSAERDRE